MDDGVDESLLTKSPFFQSFRPNERSMVAALLRMQTLRQDELLFAEDEPGDRMFVVLEGALRVTPTSAPDAQILSVLGPGEAVGEMALLLGEPRSAACRAAMPSRVGALVKDDFDQLLSQQPGMALALGRLMAQRLRRANQMAIPPLLTTQMLGLGDAARVRIGRDPLNDVLLSSPAIAPFQVELRRSDDGSYTAHNLDEVNGEPLIINGRQSSEGPVADGDTVKIGPYRFILRQTMGARGEGVGSVWLSAEGLTVERGGTTLLHDISLTIRPGDFVAITGASGAGKSTLLNALNGFRPATKGRVTLNGVSLYENLDIFRRAVGYVPQDDIVHSELTVDRALHYTAKLRLPSAPPAVLRRRIENTLKILGLLDQRDQLIGSLSGGQRKRSSIGVELITEPSLFCLDEPTSGLDPATEVRMMALLKQLAQRGQTVIMVTHATETIGMCDRVIFLAKGGHLAFAGPPLEALLHFKVDEFDAIYNLLDHDQTPEYWSAYFRSSRYARQAESRPAEINAAPTPVTAPRAQARQRAGLSQFVVLTQRYMDIMRRDTRTLTLVALQTPLIALLMWTVFPPGIFSPNPAVGSGRSALMILFVLVAAGIFFGASNASKELVKERPIFRRERLVNLRLAPYLLSKVVVLGGVAIVQSIVLIALCSLGGLLVAGMGPATYAALAGLLALTFLGGISLGLFLSAVSSNPDFATSMVPLILLPELIFSGVLAPISRMTELAQAVAQLAVAKWAFELMAHATGLVTILQAQNNGGALVLLDQYRSAFDAAGLWPHVAVLIGFTLAFLIGALIALESRARS